MPRNSALVGKSQTLPVFTFAQFEAGDFFVVNVVNVFHHSVEQELDLRMLLRALEHDLRGAEGVAAMNDRHFGGEAGEEDRFLHGGIAAADHHDFLSRKEEAVARRARRHAVADQLLLMRQAQPARRGAAGNDQSLGVNLLNAEMQQKRALAEIGAGEMRHAVFRAEAFGLLAHVLDQLRAQDAFGKSGKILDQRGHGELSAGLVAFDDQRLQVGARRVESGSVSGASGPDDDNVSSFAHGFSRCRLDG